MLVLLLVLVLILMRLAMLQRWLLVLVLVLVLVLQWLGRFGQLMLCAKRRRPTLPILRGLLQPKRTRRRQVCCGAAGARCWRIRSL